MKGFVVVDVPSDTIPSQKLIDPVVGYSWVGDVGVMMMW